MLVIASKEVGMCMCLHHKLGFILFDRFLCFITFCELCQFESDIMQCLLLNQSCRVQLAITLLCLKNRFSTFRISLWFSLSSFILISVSSVSYAYFNCLIKTHHQNCMNIIKWHMFITDIWDYFSSHPEWGCIRMIKDPVSHPCLLYKNKIKTLYSGVRNFFPIFSHSWTMLTVCSYYMPVCVWVHNYTPCFQPQGGMKAVVWTDALQFVIMFGGIIAVIVRGMVEVGGMEKVWDIAVKHDRAGPQIFK